MAKKRRQAGKQSSPLAQLAGTLFICLFALPFAGFGLFMLGWTAHDVWEHRQFQSWQATPATLLQAELKTSRGKKGRVTYRATARYRYDFAGKTYESERVALHGSGDNFGDYQEKRGKELKQLKRTGQPVTAYVNPNDPSQAILFRDLRPLMIMVKSMFGLAFGGVGFALLGGGLLSVLEGRRDSKRRQEFPDEPWRWQEKWQARRLRSTVKHAWSGLAFAALWNLIVWTVFIMAASSGDIEWPILLIVAIFPLIGIGMAGWVAYVWLQRWKWGVSELELATFPGVLGGPLAGVITVSRAIEASDGISVRLACVRSEQRGKHKTDVTVWDCEHTIVRQLTTPDRLQTLIPAKFVIPRDLPDSSADDVTWRLSALAATEGVDFHAEFDVPVFATSASQERPAEAALDDGTLFAPISLKMIASGVRARIEEDAADRKTLLFPIARHLGLTTFLTLFSVGWIAVCIGLWFTDAPRLFPIVSGLFALLFIPIMMAIALESVRLQFGRHGVAVSRRIAGFGRDRSFDLPEIADVSAVKSGMTYGETTYWNVELRDRQGRRHKLATAIPQRQHAQRLAEEIAAMVGLSETRSSSGASRMSLESELPPELRGE